MTAALAPVTFLAAVVVPDALLDDVQRRLVFRRASRSALSQSGL